MNERDITINAIIEAYLSTGVDFYLHCNPNLVDFGPGQKPPPDVVDEQANIRISILRYRVNFKNCPYINDKTVVCTLIFGGTARTVRVPFESIYAIICVEVQFGVSIPLMPQDIEQPPQPKKKSSDNELKKTTPKKKKDRSFLKVV